MFSAGKEYKVHLANCKVLLNYLQIVYLKDVLYSAWFNLFFLWSAFGFCEYEEPEATLRCIRLLNEWQIADKKLMVRFNITRYFIPV